MKIPSFRTIALKTVPIAQWLPKYTPKYALADLVAGITVGLTLIPQSIAYAALAELDPQYGLYSSLSGGFIYMVFGTIPEINIAPTALLSLLTHNYTRETHPAFAVLLCFLSGCVELIFGLLNLGFLVEFVSIPVVAGFTSAAAVIIASAQVKNLLGLKFSAEGFIDTWINVGEKIKQTKKWDAVLSIICCITLLVLRQLKNLGKPSDEEEDSVKKSNENSKLQTALWFISVSRNAIVVVLCSVAAYIFETYEMKPFSLTDSVESGFPPVEPPPFEVYYNNHTADFVEMTSELGTGIIVVPLIAIVANIAIAKAFAHGKAVDASQEMFALGICNIIGSFFKSMPVNGSFSRSAVNNASGVKTPFGGLYTGILVILSLSLLTPYFPYIPKATLGSVIICAVIFMLEITIVPTLWRINKLNIIPYAVTFFASLFLGIEYGILVGIAVDLLFMLYFAARPRIQMESITISTQHGQNYSSLKPDGAVLFPAAEHVRRAIAKASNDTSKVIVIDCVYMTRTDYTAAKGIGAAIGDAQQTGKQVIVMNAKSGVFEALEGFCNEACLFVDSNDELKRILIGGSGIQPAANIRRESLVQLEKINIDIDDNETFQPPNNPMTAIIDKIQVRDDTSNDGSPRRLSIISLKPITRRWTQAEIMLPESMRKNSVMSRC